MVVVRRRGNADVHEVAPIEHALWHVDLGLVLCGFLDRADAGHGVRKVDLLVDVGDGVKYAEGISISWSFSTYASSAGLPVRL